MDFLGDYAEFARSEVKSYRRNGKVVRGHSRKRRSGVGLADAGTTGAIGAVGGGLGLERYMANKGMKKQGIPIGSMKDYRQLRADAANSPDFKKVRKLNSDDVVRRLGPNASRARKGFTRLVTELGTEASFKPIRTGAIAGGAAGVALGAGGYGVYRGIKALRNRKRRRR